MSAMTNVHDVVRVSRKVVEYPDGTHHSGPYASTTFCFESKSPLLERLSRFEVTIFHSIGLMIEEEEGEIR